MSYPTPKELKKLADACRKAGIKSFKCGTLEFTLSDDVPQKPKRAPSVAEEAFAGPSGSEAFTTDTLTEDQLLFWSTGAAEASEKENQING